MKNTLYLVAVACLIGCQSPTVAKKATVGLAGQSSEAGTRSWLLANPDHRASFEQVARALNGQTNAETFAAIMSSLPTPTLASQNGAVYVSDPRMVVWDGKRAVIASPDARRAILAGLRRGLEPLPPMPVRAKRAQAGLPGWNTPAIAVHTNGIQMVPPPIVESPTPAIPAGKYAPRRGIYEVQRRDGSNWVTLSTLTNLVSEMRVRRVR